MSSTVIELPAIFLGILLCATGCNRDGPAVRGSADEEDTVSDTSEQPEGNETPSCPEGTTPEETPNGVVVETACVRPDGTRHGPMIARYRDGRVAVRGQYREGLEVGTWRWWDRVDILEPGEIEEAAASMAHGPKTREGEFRAGKRVGVWREWAPDTGALISQRRYADGVPTGDSKQWWPNGQLRKTYSFRDGHPHGEIIEFHPQGHKKAEGTLSRGKRTGQWTGWHPDGQKHWQGRYEDDRRIGQWTWWDESGSIVKTCTFAEDGTAEECDEP